MASPIERFYELFGRRLQSHRLNRRLTQEQLGNMLKPRMTRASIANIESGKQRVLVHTLVQMKVALQVPLADFIPNEQEAELRGGLNQLETELASKLQLPPRRLAALAAKLGSAGSGHKK